jgi:hypothetical protein
MADDSTHVVSHADKMCARTCCPCNVNLEELKPLVNNPKFICKQCGRVSNEDKLVCEPVPLA